MRERGLTMWDGFRFAAGVWLFSLVLCAVGWIFWSALIIRAIQDASGS